MQRRNVIGWLKIKFLVIVNTSIFRLGIRFDNLKLFLSYKYFRFRPTLYVFRKNIFIVVKTNRLTISGITVAVYELLTGNRS